MGEALVVAVGAGDARALDDLGVAHRPSTVADTPTAFRRATPPAPIRYRFGGGGSLDPGTNSSGIRSFSCLEGSTTRPGPLRRRFAGESAGLLDYSTSNILAGVVRNPRTNPLALAVLACLYEEPMHPYEVAQTLRTRAKHESIRLNYGSLYSVVESLEHRGLIEATETVRHGRRPERTVYALTSDGERELFDWLSDLVTTPVKEYLQFEAALSLLPVLPPEDATALLRQRAQLLEVLLASDRARGAAVEQEGVPRLFMLELDYLVALRAAELDFVQRLVKDIESGELSGLDLWHSWFADGSPGAEPAEPAAGPAEPAEPAGPAEPAPDP